MNMTGLLEALNISTSPYLNALVIIIVFIILAKALDLIIDKGLRKLTRFTKSDIDDRISRSFLILLHRTAM